MIVARQELPGKSVNTIRPVGNGMKPGRRMFAAKMIKQTNRSYRTYGTGSFVSGFPGSSCLATITLSLRDGAIF